MKTIQKYRLYIGILAVIVVGGIVFTIGSNDVADVDSGKTTTTNIGGVSIDLPEGAVIIPIPIESTIPLPVLVRDVAFPDYYNEEAKTLMRDKIATAIVNIEGDNTDFGNWLELANLRSSMEDYTGALEIYEYLNVASPTNSVSFVNAGNTYHLYLKDYPKAEENLKQALVNSSSSIHNVRSLYELYLYSYKTDTGLAGQTLLDALVVAPDSIDLMVLLAEYYKNAGDDTSAKTYYEKARDEAKNRQNFDLLYILEQEIGKL